MGYRCPLFLIEFWKLCPPKLHRLTLDEPYAVNVGPVHGLGGGGHCVVSPQSRFFGFPSIGGAILKLSSARSCIYFLPACLSTRHWHCLLSLRRRVTRIRVTCLPYPARGPVVASCVCARYSCKEIKIGCRRRVTTSPSHTRVLRFEA